ncbi:hypothetical protein B0H14DRAFT_3498833 [Mycena olivaceomarginata]|nr:hypothetical protein B0H14DRAFT_3498833 [Mycena olivaceomarginata]
MAFKFFQKLIMHSLSNFAALLVSFILTVNAAPVRLAPEIGNPSSPLHNMSELQCLEACHTSSGCIAYAYVPYGSDPNDAAKTAGSCYLKDTIVLGDFVKQKFDISAGLLGPCGTFSPVRSQDRLLNASQCPTLLQNKSDIPDGSLSPPDNRDSPDTPTFSIYVPAFLPHCAFGPIHLFGTAWFTAIRTATSLSN